GRSLRVRFSSFSTKPSSPVRISASGSPKSAVKVRSKASCELRKALSSASRLSFRKEKARVAPERKSSFCARSTRSIESKESAGGAEDDPGSIEVDVMRLEALRQKRAPVSDARPGLIRPGNRDHPGIEPGQHLLASCKDKARRTGASLPGSAGSHHERSPKHRARSGLGLPSFLGGHDLR